MADYAKSLKYGIIICQFKTNMYSGYVDKEVLLYIWDQYIIGLDSPGFTDDYLPAITAVFLKLVADRLKSQKMVSFLKLPTKYLCTCYWEQTFV